MPKKPSKEGASDLDMLRELIKLLESSSVASLRLKRGGAEYEVSRNSTVHAAQGAPAAPDAHVVAGAGAASAASAAPPAAAPSNLIEIKSPMVGTFYRSPEPGSDPYVKAGSRVAPGQTLCIIEAMKIMNEIECEVSGRVREILVEDAQPVEFGQVLFRVEPNA